MTGCVLCTFFVDDILDPLQGNRSTTSPRHNNGGDVAGPRRTRRTRRPAGAPTQALEHCENNRSIFSDLNQTGGYNAMSSSTELLGARPPSPSSQPITIRLRKDHEARRRHAQATDVDDTTQGLDGRRCELVERYGTYFPADPVHLEDESGHVRNYLDGHEVMLPKEACGNELKSDKAVSLDDVFLETEMHLESQTERNNEESHLNPGDEEQPTEGSINQPTKCSRGYRETASINTRTPAPHDVYGQATVFQGADMNAGPFSNSPTFDTLHEMVQLALKYLEKYDFLKFVSILSQVNREEAQQCADFIRIQKLAFNTTGKLGDIDKERIKILTACAIFIKREFHPNWAYPVLKNLNDIYRSLHIVVKAKFKVNKNHSCSNPAPGEQTRHPGAVRSKSIDSLDKPNVHQGSSGPQEPHRTRAGTTGDKPSTEQTCSRNASRRRRRRHRVQSVFRPSHKVCPDGDDINVYQVDDDIFVEMEGLPSLTVSAYESSSTDEAHHTSRYVDRDDTKKYPLTGHFPIRDLRDDPSGDAEYIGPLHLFGRSLHRQEQETCVWYVMMKPHDIDVGTTSPVYGLATQKISNVRLTVKSLI